MTTHDWLKNPNELERVKALLTQTGYPLEVRVAGVCQSFDQWGDIEWSHSASKAHDPFVYRDGEILREVDRLLEIHANTEVANDAGYGLSVALTVPIECKHRENVSVFGFPIPDHKQTLLPIVSGYAPTRLFQALRGRKSPFDEQSPCIVTMLEKDAKGWKKPAKEDLFHNASSSLYDAMVYVLKPDTDFPSILTPPPPNLDELIDGISPHPFMDLQWVVQSRLRDVSADQLNDFNKLFDEFHELDIEIIMPVVAVDMPIYRVSLGANGEIKGIETASWLAMYQRVGRGLAPYHDQLLDPTLELPVIVVHVDALDELLRHLVTWCNKLLELIYSADDDLWRHVLLEATVFWNARNRQLKE